MTLTDELNHLLQGLQISIPNGLQSPSDLTPSLLLAILESLLGERLPISDNLRHSKDHISKMKVFLGVLETDILQGDNMQLSSIDPRRLARGDWDEVVRVGEALCWIGRRLGLIRDTSDSPTVTATARTNSGVSVAESATTPEYEDDSTSSTYTPPRCIHEIPSPLVALSPTLEWADEESYSNNYLLSIDTKITPPVQHEGLIAPADEDWELASFQSINSSLNIGTESKKTIYDYADEDQEQKTRALLKQRAKLLAQIAKLEGLKS